MPTTNVTIDVRDVMHRVTLVVKLTHIHQLRWRLWLGTQLIRLSTWIVGCGIEIVEDETEEETNVAR